jgi:sigma-B regulation protein RsbU (phosphoserine phosphatase)
MFPAVTYEARAISLVPGDMVVLYTDGITEARNMDNQEFGEETLTNLLKKSFKQPAAKVVEKVMSEVTEFSAGTPPMDDMTFVVIKRSA